VPPVDAVILQQQKQRNDELAVLEKRINDGAVQLAADATRLRELSGDAPFDISRAFLGISDPLVGTISTAFFPPEISCVASVPEVVVGAVGEETRNSISSIFKTVMATGFQGLFGCVQRTRPRASSTRQSNRVFKGETST